MTGHEDADAIPPALAPYLSSFLARAFMRTRVHGRLVMPPGRHPRDLAVLATLNETGPVSQRRLGELLTLNRTLMVELIDGLEDSGLVSRERDPADRRSHAVTLTGAGRAALGPLRAAAAKGEAALAAALSPAEHERLNELLRRLQPHPAGPPAELFGYTGFLVAASHLRLREQGRLALRELGLEPRHFALLAVLDGIEPCSQQRLAGELGVTGPAVVGTIDDLEAAGRVVRERDPGDRRRHTLRITDRGRADLASAHGAMEGIQREVTGRVGAADMAELTGLLTRLTG